MEREIGERSGERSEGESERRGCGLPGS